MREILFHGKRIDNGEWIEGYYVKTVDYLNDSAVHLIIESPSTFYPRGEIAGEYEIIFSTVGQFTGLNDKNGKKIFEGDICKFREWDNGEMCWIGHVHFEHCQFIISGRANKERSSDFYLVLSRFSPENIEVIGNIHDSPELLEDDK